MTEKLLTGRLENWWFDEKNNVFWGNLYDDLHERWHDGAYIHTSMCYNPTAQSGDIIKTRNSTYLLGDKQIEQL